MFAISLNPIDWFTDAAGGIVGGATDAVFNYFLDLVLEALDWLARQIATLFVDAGAPTFGAGAAGVSSLMVYVALVVVIGGAMLQAALTAVRPNSSSTSALADLPITVLALGSVYAIAAVWLGFTDAVAQVVLTDTVRQSFSGGLQMNTAIVPFLRLLFGLCMVLFMVLLFVEQLIRAHLLATVIVMLPVGVAARVWEPARYLSVAMVKIFVALSITPILTGVSMSLALANFNAAGPLDFVHMVGALAGMAVTTLMPFMVFKLFPIGADGGGGAGLAAAGGAIGVAKLGQSTTGKFGSSSRDATGSTAGGTGGGSGGGAGSAAGGPVAMAAEAGLSAVRTAGRAATSGAREATEAGPPRQARAPRTAGTQASVGGASTGGTRPRPTSNQPGASSNQIGELTGQPGADGP